MPIVGDVNDSLPLTLAGSSHLLATTDDHKSLEIFSMNDEFFATNLTTKLPPLADIYKSAFDDVSFRQNKLRHRNGHFSQNVFNDGGTGIKLKDGPG